MTETPAPRRIEWAAPEGWTVWADEDGVHLRTARGEGLEMPDVERLLTLWHDARAAVQNDRSVPAPKPPTREEARAMIADQREEYALRRAVRAVKREFAPSDTPAPPF